MNELLSADIIAANKEKFIELISTIERDGADIDRLIAKLESSDFFTAPASSMYHGAYPGGLCDHSLNVYYNLCSLIKNKHIENYDDNTIKIVALLHDISKMNYYEIYNQNKKVYSPAGTKRDDGGSYDWTVVKSYKKRDVAEQFIYGTHGQNSAFMINVFIPMSLEESAAVIHHMGQYDNAPGVDLSVVHNKYPLALLLHVADMLSTFIDERICYE